MVSESNIELVRTRMMDQKEVNCEMLIEVVDRF